MMAMTDLHLTTSGEGPVLVFLHGLGMDHSLFDDLADALPDTRVIRPDLRGHGQSEAPAGPYSMGALVKDVETALDKQGVRDAVVFGLSLGGMIAQGLAVKRLDLVRGLVLCGTAAKFGQPGPWHDRAKTARRNGMSALVDGVMEKWAVTTSAARQRFLQTPAEGYAATCEAIAGTDFYTPTASLRLPTLGLGGDKDRSTPPDLVRETTELIPGAEFKLLRGAGHLAPETHPSEVLAELRPFLRRIGHI